MVPQDGFDQQEREQTLRDLLIDVREAVMVALGKPSIEEREDHGLFSGSEAYPCPQCERATRADARTMTRKRKGLT